MTTVTASGEIRGGRLRLEDRPAFDRAVAALGRGPVRVRVELVEATRSLQQNRYYFGVVLHLISEHTGYEPEELHAYFKQRFIPKAVAIADRNGLVHDALVIGGTTTSLSTAEFSDYCERIRRFAAVELGLSIPDAGEVAA